MLQALLAAGIFLITGFAPPAHGRMLLVPLSGEPVSAAMLDRLMFSRLREGPLPGSVIVEGRGRGLAAMLLDQGIVMLAAPAVLCGPTSSGGKDSND